ncbi:discoidin domain-containing protein [Aerococcaceae bacterium NML191292]|nr:discoidin domain-containing protein [Aerococcaceae bacterium NML191292]
MLGRNNVGMLRQKLESRFTRYAIKKLNVGVASIAVGMGIFILGGNVVNAETQPFPEENRTIANFEEPVAIQTSSGSENVETTSSEEMETTVAPEVERIAVENQTLDLVNEYIGQKFEVKEGKLRTVELENKLTTEKIVFEEGSKEFTIQLKTSDPIPVPPAYEPYSDDRQNWTVRATSQASRTSTQEGPISLAFDGNVNTIWHNNYGSGVGPVNTLPESVEIDFPEARSVKTFIYTPRQNGDNGDAKGYKIYAKDSESTDYREVTSGALTNVSSKVSQVIALGDLKAVTSMKFEILSTQNGRPFSSAAEFDVSDKAIAELQEIAKSKREAYLNLLEEHASANQINLGNLTLAEDGIQRETTATGKRLIFTFNPYEYKGTPVSVKYVVDLRNDAKFTQRHLEIKVPDEYASNFVIDTIDLQSYKLNGEDKVWKLPSQAAIAEMSGFNGFYAGLGQPVYVKSFYTGSEFPSAWNTVNEQQVLFSRYYSGKNFSQLAKDEQGYFRTWNTVFGVARSDDYQVLQQDFYQYIKEIGQKTYYRKQYNSWFDHMKNITATNIQDSFNEIEKGFTDGGVAPLDSFVVDDGWQKVRSLWQFNHKFPNKLYDSSKQAQKLGSNFGLWMGPQGGYGNPGEMADALVRQGLGSKHAGVVYIGDKRYVDGLHELFKEYGDKFDINYWKLDGLLLRPRSDTDPNGNFIGGGHMNMYSMTETHERWIGLYETIRSSAKEPDKMWINLTSYVSPSPWYLQWVNSIWMQNAGDVDFQDGVKKREYIHLDFGNDANEAITYRDDRYEELVNLRKWQLPFANIYNHDPVYGLTAHSTKKLSPGGAARPEIQFTTDDLRTYLYMLGTRGTGFWEFYYSYSKMDDEKWQVNGEAVNWIENNYETLKNARFHGGKPGHGEVYGYSAWNGNEGIVSIRNPINATQTYKLRLDRLVGVPEALKDVYRTTILGSKHHDTSELTQYNDEITIELAPYETVIFQYSSEQDKQEAKVLTAKNTGTKEIKLTFDERVYIDDATFHVEGNEIISSTLNADLRTVTLTLASALIDGSTINLTYQGIKDNAAVANVSEGTLALRIFDAGRIEDISTVKPGVALTNTGVEGVGEFSVTVKATLTQLNQVLAEQEGQWKLSVDGEGRIVFNVKDLEVKSAPFTHIREDDRGKPDKLIAPDETFVVTAVRNRNGSLRLYLNGEVHNTAYDKHKVNERLDLSSLTVGTTGMEGEIHRFILEQNARDFKSVQSLLNELSPKAQKIVLTVDANKVSATSFDPNDGGERPARAAFDGNRQTYWASSTREDNTVNKQMLTFGFEEEQTVDAVGYTPRQIANAVGNIKSAYIEYSIDNEHWLRVEHVDANEDNTITLNPADINKQYLSFKPIQAKYLRIVALESVHWRESDVNKIVAASEVEATVEHTTTVEAKLTYAYLRNLFNQALRVDKERYTPTSYQTLEALLNEREQLLQLDQQANIDAAYERLSTALSNLEELPKSFTDTDSNIKITFSSPVNHIESMSVVDLDEALLGEQSEVIKNSDSDLFEIKFKDKSQADVKVNTPATVEMAVDSGKKVARVIHFIPETGEIQDLDFTQVGDQVIFGVLHFSIYGVVYESPVAPPSGDKPEDVPAPPSGDKPEDVPAPPSGDKPEDVPAPPSGDKPEDVPAPPSSDKPEDVPAPPSGDKPEDVPAPPSGDKPEDVPAPPSGDKPEDVSAPPSGDKPEDVPAPPSGDKPEDVPAPPSGDKPEDVPAPPSGDKPEDVPAPPSGDKPEDVPAPPSGDKPEDVPAPPSGDKPEDVPAPPTIDRAGEAKTEKEALSAKDNQVASSTGVEGSASNRETAQQMLPNTGEADEFLIFGEAALAILLGLGLVSKRQRKFD